MDIKLKQRLVGGAVLVLLAVIFVPMLFEDALERGEERFHAGMLEPPPPGEMPRNTVIPPQPHLPLPSGWVVQVGSFSKAKNAQALETRLREAGFPAFVDTTRTRAGALYRVRVGPVLEKNEAAAILSRIQKSLGLEGFVIAYSP